MSTFCATFKHKMSFDPISCAWQLGCMHIGERIALARRAAGLSQGALGERVGAGQTTVSSWERGRTEPTRDDVQRIAAVLGVPPATLELGDQRDGDRIRRTVPLVGYVGAGDAAHYYDVGQGELDRVDAPEGANDNTVAAKIQGTSLGPLLDGWLVFWDEVRNPVTTDMYGELCVVGLLDQRILVKQIRPAGTPGRYHLISNNEAPILDVEVAWAAKVTEMRPR